MATQQTLVCLDPGENVTGVVILRDGLIVLAENTPNWVLLNIIFDANIQKSSDFQVLVEDIRPYGTKLSPQIIATCKFLGQLEWRLQEAEIGFKLIPRNTVKKWVFDTFPDVCRPIIEKKMAKKGSMKADGTPKAPSFVWVDDRIVISAMKECWNIETPKPGKTNRYGINAHSWQSLALGSFYINIQIIQQ